MYCVIGKIHGCVALCNDWLPQRQESPQGPADLGSAIGLAPQSPGLLGCLRDVYGGIIVDILAKESKFP